MHHEHTVSSLERAKAASRDRSRLTGTHSSLSPVRNASQSPSTCRKSDKFYKGLRTKIFKSIFRQLDSDNDGSISVSNMHIDSLDLEVIKVLEPIFDNMERKQAVYDQKQFLKRCNNLFKHIDPNQRDKILKFKKNHSESMVNPNLTFTPEITEKAKEIVQKLYTGESMVERLHRQHNQRRERLMKAKEKQEKDEMLE